MIDLAHVHPMLVHFPIVLFLLGSGIELVALLRGRDLAARECLPATARWIVVLAALAAIVTAMFGDAALEHAAKLGFPTAAMEQHEGLGWTTMWFFLVYAGLYLFAWWRGFALSGGRGWIWFLVSAVGVVLVIVTAYFGGELVYRIGVNVAPVTP
jgi:uncharacterized membrane protein